MAGCPATVLGRNNLTQSPQSGLTKSCHCSETGAFNCGLLFRLFRIQVFCNLHKDVQCALLECRSFQGGGGAPVDCLSVKAPRLHSSIRVGAPTVKVGFMAIISHPCTAAFWPVSASRTVALLQCELTTPTRQRSPSALPTRAIRHSRSIVVSSYLSRKSH
jgi:hypothetical protein